MTTPDNCGVSAHEVILAGIPKDHTSYEAATKSEILDEIAFKRSGGAYAWQTHLKLTFHKINC